MRKLFFLLLSISFLFYGCYNDDITVTLNQSGILRISVVDENQNGLADVQVLIEDYELGVTDESGIYQSQALLQGVHYCSAYVKEGKITYFDSKRVQVIAGEDKKVELSPFTNVGEVTIKVISWNTYRPVGKVNLALINSFYWDQTLEEIVENALFIGQTDYDGIVEFKKLPVDTYYHAIIYDDSMNWYQDNYSFSVRKEEKTDFTFYYYE